MSRPVCFYITQWYISLYKSMILIFLYFYLCVIEVRFCYKKLFIRFKDFILLIGRVTFTHWFFNVLTILSATLFCLPLAVSRILYMKCLWLCTKEEYSLEAYSAPPSVCMISSSLMLRSFTTLLITCVYKCIWMLSPLLSFRKTLIA